MESVNSVYEFLRGVINAVIRKVSGDRPSACWIFSGIHNAFFFLVGCLQRTNINIQYGLRLPEGIDTICRVESKDAPVIPPTGTPQIRVDVRYSMRRLFPLEMPMGGL